MAHRPTNAADDSDHLHLVCRVCGAIEEMPPDVLDQAVQHIADDPRASPSTSATSPSSAPAQPVR